ncbi:hypothetical protein [Microcoleus sp. herbarium12]|jgi:hypothetical protein|uniref:hypothetical protein n=1 Tax=Microcoleus sp. herbarium12 TaxID=3055437 RepID=UPI002FCEAF75
MATTKKQTAATPNRSQSPVPAKSKPPEKQNSQTVGSNNGAKSKPQPNLSSEQLAVELVKQIRNTIHKKYGVTIQRRDSRISTKVGHAIREKLGLDIQAQLNKRNGNGNGKKFDWQEWNNTVFPKLVGRPDELKYDVEVVALAMSQLYDTIADNPQAAIADLMEFNAQSLKRRNELAKSSEEDTEELDEDDDDDDEDDDILDEIDEDDDDEEGDEESDEDDDEEDDFSLDEDEEFEEDDE